MILPPRKLDEMLEAAKPLIKWLNDNCHPHCEARVDQDSVTIMEQFGRNITAEFIKD